MIYDGADHRRPFEPFMNSSSLNWILYYLQ